MASSKFSITLRVNTTAFERACLRVEAELLARVLEECSEWTAVGQEARDRLQQVHDRLAVLDLIAGA